MPLSPSRRARLEALFAKPFAHRGLHGAGVVENSRAAFRAAIRAGHGIELDVQGSLMREAVVFHDDGLERLTDSEGRVGAYHLEELEQIKLKGSDETIPWLNDVLALIAGRAPMLIEVKAPRHDVAALSRSVAYALKDYIGPVAVMSFNPSVPRWFARHAPEVLRGLVVTEEGRPERGRLKRRLSLHWSKADFLAYDIRDLPSAFAAASGLPVATWTVRTEAQRATAAAHADQIIYEVAG
ncbi:MAG: glycerophosphodiester phosphodiesterase family protein [Sphingosinicella sp.]|uniref:glycerophosphodiester phosphodiesterase family protein n=1 Tax=Sphingosinicella sp. TaxID=1917971 RepID=UPI0040384EC4